MANRFGVLLRPILQSYENSIATVKAVIVLHNYLREQMPEEELQVEVSYLVCIVPTLL